MIVESALALYGFTTRNVMHLRLVNRQWNSAVAAAFAHRPLRGLPTHAIRVLCMELTTANKALFYPMAFEWTKTIDVHSSIPIRPPALKHLLQLSPKLTALKLDATNLTHLFYNTLPSMPPSWGNLHQLTIRNASLLVPTRLLLDTLPRLTRFELINTGITVGQRPNKLFKLQNLVFINTFPEKYVDAFLQSVNVTESIWITVVTNKMVFNNENKLTHFGKMLQRLSVINLSGSPVDRLPMLTNATDVCLEAMSSEHLYAVIHKALNPKSITRFVARRNWTTLALLQTLDLCSYLTEVILCPLLYDCFPNDFTKLSRKRVFSYTPHSLEWRKSII